MKSFKLIMPALMAVSLLAFSATEIDGIYVWKDGNYTRFNLNEITFSDNKIRIADTTMSVEAIDSITFTKPTDAPRCVGLHCTSHLSPFLTLIYHIASYSDTFITFLLKTRRCNRLTFRNFVLSEHSDYCLYNFMFEHYKSTTIFANHQIFRQLNFVELT